MMIVGNHTLDANQSIVLLLPESRARTDEEEEDIPIALARNIFQMVVGAYLSVLLCRHTQSMNGRRYRNRELVWIPAVGVLFTCIVQAFGLWTASDSGPFYLGFICTCYGLWIAALFQHVILHRPFLVPVAVLYGYLCDVSWFPSIDAPLRMSLVTLLWHLSLSVECVLRLVRRLVRCRQIYDPHFPLLKDVLSTREWMRTSISFQRDLQRYSDCTHSLPRWLPSFCGDDLTPMLLIYFTSTSSSSFWRSFLYSPWPLFYFLFYVFLVSLSFPFIQYIVLCKSLAYREQALARQVDKSKESTEKNSEHVSILRHLCHLAFIEIRCPLLYLIWNPLTLSLYLSLLFLFAESQT